MSARAITEPSQAKANPEIYAATVYVKSQDPRVVELGLKLFKGIVKKEEGLAEAAAVASRFLIFDGTVSQAIYYQDSIQRAALKLLKHLTDRGHGKAAEVAAVLVQWSQPIYNQLRGVELLTTLVKNSQSCDLALKVGLSLLAKNEISNPSDASFTTASSVIALLQELVEKEQFPDKISEAASTFVLAVTDPRKGNAGVDLFKTLIRKKFAFHQATQIAIALTGSEHFWKQSLGINLFKALVKEGQSYAEAAKAAKQLKNCDLFRELIKKGQAHQEAEETVSSHVRSLGEDRSGFADVMPLSVDLIASGRFFKEGEELGLALLASKKSIDHWWAVNIFIALASQGKAIESGRKVIEAFRSVSSLAEAVTLLSKAISIHQPRGEK